jgi:hypothetical protein
MDKQTLSNYGWIVICILVLVVMVALATPLGDFIAGGIKSTAKGFFGAKQEAMESAGMKVDDQDFEEKEDLSKIIPAGAVYYVGITSDVVGEYETATEKLIEEEKMPDTVSENDVFVYGNYEYRYNKHYNGSVWKTNATETDGWGVRCINDTAYPGQIMEKINDKPIVTIECAFSGLETILIAPNIPSGVANVTNAFKDCTTLKSHAGNNVADGDFSAYVLPSGVTSLKGMFIGCELIVVAPQIPENVTELSGAFNGCNKILSLYYPCTLKPSTPNDFPNEVRTAQYHVSGCGHTK